ncbi:MAG TPA: POTRA domain-containing protein [Terriglobales bacterium]|nr:POTRA domain-containing protein [Terriglobales bacterium]
MKRLLLCFCLVASFPVIGQTGSFVDEDQLQQPSALTIRSIIFENTGRLSEPERREITRKIRREGELPDHAVALAEERVREACQDEGYFEVKVSGVAEHVAGKDDGQFDIAVKVLDYGKQYRLREIRFTNGRAFSQEELLKLIPVQPGEVFSRARIATGLEAIHQHYQDAGYLNITSIPNTEFDETNATVRLDIDLDEGKLFHWGELRVTGLESQKAQVLTDGWEDLRGKPYSPDALREFCARFFPAADGTDPAKYTKSQENETMGTVDVSIEFVSPWWISN